MANETFVDGERALKYRKSTGAGTSGDPAVLHNNIDTVIPGTAAASLGKAEDAAHGSGDTGVYVLGVRQDADTSPVSADGDYHGPVFDNAGNLKVNIKAGAGSGGTAIADGASFTPATTSFTPIGGEVDDAATATVAEGKGGAARISPYRGLHVVLYDSGGVEQAVGGGTQYNEDTASADAQKLTMAGVVRRDAAATGAGTDGDRTELSVDATGRLWANVNVVTPGTAAANLGKAEDAAHSSGDVGVMGMTVRQDTAAALSGTDGDYQPAITDANGRLHVIEPSAAAAAASLSVMDDWDASDRCKVSPVVGQVGVAAGAGTTDALTQRVTLAVDDVLMADALTSLQLIDDVVKTDDAAFTPGTTKVLMIGAQFDAVATDSVDEGDAGALRMTADRQLLVTEASAAAAAASLALLDDVVITDDAAFTPATSKVLMIGAQFDDAGTDSVDEGDAGAIRMTADRRLKVEATGSGTLTVGGVAAHDAAISGNPVRVGGRALSADVTAVATGDTADLITDLVGKLINLPYAIPENHLYGAVTSTITGTTSTEVIAAQASGIRIYVTQLSLFNSDATVGTWVKVTDGSGGTAMFTAYLAAAGGGVTATFPVPLKTTAATALHVVCETTSAEVRCSASGYKGV